MKLFVPEIGNVLVLTAKWDFNLYREYRNAKLITALGLEEEPGFLAWRTHRANMDHAERREAIKADKDFWEPYSHAVSLPAGSILKVSRVYIRQGASDYSSMSFTVDGKSAQLGIKTKPRFWAKLRDCNNIEFKHD